MIIPFLHVFSQPNKLYQVSILVLFLSPAYIENSLEHNI